MSGPIPADKVSEFVAFMECSDMDDMPDGAWFQILEDAAAAFMKQQGIKGCSNSAVHQYLQSRG